VLANRWQAIPEWGVARSREAFTHISETADRLRCCQLKWVVSVVNWWRSRSPVYLTVSISGDFSACVCVCIFIHTPSHTHAAADRRMPLGSASHLMCCTHVYGQWDKLVTETVTSWQQQHTAVATVTVFITLWPFDLWVNACWATTIEYVFGVDSLSHFSLRAWTNRHRCTWTPYPRRRLWSQRG